MRTAWNLQILNLPYLLIVDAATLPVSHGNYLYIVIGVKDEVLYVGQTIAVDLWKQVGATRVAVVWLNESDSIEQFEADLIERFQPGLNSLAANSQII